MALNSKSHGELNGYLDVIKDELSEALDAIFAERIPSIAKQYLILLNATIPPTRDELTELAEVDENAVRRKKFRDLEATETRLFEVRKRYAESLYPAEPKVYTRQMFDKANYMSVNDINDYINKVLLDGTE